MGVMFKAILFPSFRSLLQAFYLPFYNLSIFFPFLLTFFTSLLGFYFFKELTHLYVGLYISEPRAKPI